MSEFKLPPGFYERSRKEAEKCVERMLIYNYVMQLRMAFGYKDYKFDWKHESDRGD